MAEPATAERVRGGLVLLVGDPRWWPVAHPGAFRNRLLDEGGGDSRPHVELAWRLHELGVADRLARADGAPMARCRAVARDLAAEAFLDREAALWGVVSWGLALGIVSDAVVAGDAAALARLTHGPEAAARAAAPARATDTPRPARTGAIGIAVPATPGPIPPPRRRWSIGTPGTPRSPLPKGPPVGAVLGLLGLIGGLFAVAIGGARLLRPARNARPAFETPAPVVPPPEAVAPAPVAPPPPAVPPPAVPPGMRGDVRLRDGRRLNGVIDLVTASDVFLHDPSTGLPIAMPLAFVSEVRTADGRVAWAAPGGGSAGGSDAGRRTPPAVALRERGVGGTYRVTVRSATIDGDRDCRDAWGAVGRDLTETIAHVPGATTATLTSRARVTLRIAADGAFSAGPTDGVDGPTRWRFAMAGRFAPAGFVATTDLRTETTLRWRKVRRCWVRADLAGVRRR